MLELRLIISGRVQQVGFRYSVMAFIESLGQDIRGYVKNLPDGRVEVVAQGEIESLKSLHRFATKGPPRAEVREVLDELKLIEGFSYQKFEILR